MAIGDMPVGARPIELVGVEVGRTTVLELATAEVGVEMGAIEADVGATVVLLAVLVVGAVAIGATPVGARVFLLTVAIIRFH